MRMLELRIADRPLIRLIMKWLKAGVMEAGSEVDHPARAAPQGGVVFPILANIHLHHVHDEWIRKGVAKRCKGQMLFRHHGDDRAVGFEPEDDARADMRASPKRLGKFSLILAGEGSSLVEFNRAEPEQAGSSPSLASASRNDYGITGNSRMISAYGFEVAWLLFQGLNRRSQRCSMTSTRFTRCLRD